MSLQPGWWLIFILIQLWSQFFQMFVYGDVVYAIDPENLYPAAFICQDGLCCCNMALISFLLFHKKLGNLRDFFGQMVYRPPWQKISRTPMLKIYLISWFLWSPWRMRWWSCICFSVVILCINDNKPTISSVRVVLIINNFPRSAILLNRSKRWETGPRWSSSYLTSALQSAI